MSLRLGVNIDHVATIRQARYKVLGHGAAPEPSPLVAALECEKAGAHSITAHLREDRRHIQDADVIALKKKLRIPLNLEMAVTEEMVRIALKLRPAEVCLVPEKRQELTTEGGLDVVRSEKAITSATRRLNKAGILVSLFIDADENQVSASARSGAAFIELHTGRFANAATPSEQKRMVKKLTQAAELAHKLGLQVNAGHGLNYVNLPALFPVPHLHTLNIGHTIVSRAVSTGISRAVKDLLRLMKPYHG